jgi:hypothetical protein
MHNEEIKELGHAPKPGYRPAFLLIFAVSSLYLALIFAKSLGVF